MTQMLIKSETLDEIANAIRTKTGKTEAMTPIEMARAINEPSSYAWKKYSVTNTTSGKYYNGTFLFAKNTDTLTGYEGKTQKETLNIIEQYLGNGKWKFNEKLLRSLLEVGEVSEYTIPTSSSPVTLSGHFVLLGSPYIAGQDYNSSITLTYNQSENSWYASADDSDLIFYEVAKGDFLSYITSDSILSYPLNGQKGDYWYELVQSNVDCGEITLTSDQTAIAVQHNLGEVPKWAGIFPNEKITSTTPGNNATKYEIPLTTNWTGTYENAGHTYDFTVARSSFTNTQIQFKAYSSSYPFRSSGNGWGTYYWFALGSPKSSLLSILSWQQIGDLVLKAEQGTVNLSDYFSIGDTKPVTLTTGETIELQIAGFNHDTFSDGVTAPVTFVMKDCLNTTAKMNSSDINTTGGYTASAMKTWVENNIYNKLPADLKAIVAPVKKKCYTTYNQASSLIEANYNVWLLAEAEVFDSVSYTVGNGEGTKYPIFTDNTSRVKKVNGSLNSWWLRSASSSSSTNFVCVFPDGYVSNNFASLSIGVAVGLCIRGGNS